MGFMIRTVTDSHHNDGSKKLKYDQIILVHEAAKTAPALSGAVLRRNLMDTKV